MMEVLVQPDESPGPVGEGSERGVEEPEGKRPPNTGARLWGRVRSKLLRQKVLFGGLGGLGDTVVGTKRVLGQLRRVAGLWGVWWLWLCVCLCLGGGVFLIWGGRGVCGERVAGSARGAGKLLGWFGNSSKQFAACGGGLFLSFPSACWGG